MEVKATNNGNSEQRVEDAPFSFLDDPISDLVSEGDHEDGAEKKVDSEKKDDETISPVLQARFDKVDEEREIDRQTIQFLKGQNSILETQLRGGDKKEEVKETPLLKLPDKAKLQAALSDPDTAVDALTGMFEEFGKNILERINKVDETGRTEHQRRDQRARWQSDMAQDIQEAKEEYGEDVLGQKEFITEADKEMEKVIARRGGRSLADVQPGDFSAVASRVYARWLKAGKINGEARNGNNDLSNRRPTLREISREVSSSDRSVTNGGPRGGGNSGAKVISDLGMSPRDTRIAQAAAKRMGVSEEAWVRNYNAGQAEDEGYGR